VLLCALIRTSYAHSFAISAISDKAAHGGGLLFALCGSMSIYGTLWSDLHREADQALTSCAQTVVRDVQSPGRDPAGMGAQIPRLSSCR
jgi:hypothetical protein